MKTLLVGLFIAAGLTAQTRSVSGFEKPVFRIEKLSSEELQHLAKAQDAADNAATQLEAAKQRIQAAHGVSNWHIPSGVSNLGCISTTFSVDFKGGYILIESRSYNLCTSGVLPISSVE